MIRVVVAGNYEQFLYFCHEKHIDRRKVIYVSEPNRLRGLLLKPDQVAYYGTYYERSDWDEIQWELKARMQ